MQMHLWGQGMHCRASEIIYLQICYDVYTIGFVGSLNVPTPPVVFDVIQDHTNVIPNDPGTNRTLDTSLHSTVATFTCLQEPTANMHDCSLT